MRFFWNFLAQCVPGPLFQICRDNPGIEEDVASLGLRQWLLRLRNDPTALKAWMHDLVPDTLSGAFATHCRIGEGWGKRSSQHAF